MGGIKRKGVGGTPACFPPPSPLYVPCTMHVRAHHSFTVLCTVHQLATIFVFQLRVIDREHFKLQQAGRRAADTKLKEKEVRVAGISRGLRGYD